MAGPSMYRPLPHESGRGENPVLDRPFLDGMLQKWDGRQRIADLLSEGQLVCSISQAMLRVKNSKDWGVITATGVLRTRPIELPKSATVLFRPARYVPWVIAEVPLSLRKLRRQSQIGSSNLDVRDGQLTNQRRSGSQQIGS
ncbi:hypothetical protein ABIB56_001529 [Glaciihabitans sp. UYNi722]